MFEKIKVTARDRILYFDPRKFVLDFEDAVIKAIDYQFFILSNQSLFISRKIATS